MAVGPILTGGLLYTPSLILTLGLEVSSDTTPPTLTGTLSLGSGTSSTQVISWPSGSDDIGVAGYEYSVGGSYISMGNVLTYTITGLTASTAYTVSVRAYDAAGNRSTPAITNTFTTAAASSGSVTTDPIWNNTLAAVLASTAVSWTWLPGGRIGSLSTVTPVDGTGTTSSTGTLTVAKAAPGILMVCVRHSSAVNDDVFYQAFS